MNKSNTRKIAENVQKIQTEEKPEQHKSPVIVCTPEIQTIKNILALEGANLLRRLSKNLIVNEQQNCDEEVESIMHHIKVDALGGARKSSLTPASFTDSLRTSRRGSAIGFR